MTTFARDRIDRNFAIFILSQISKMVKCRLFISAWINSSRSFDLYAWDGVNTYAVGIPKFMKLSFTMTFPSHAPVERPELIFPVKIEKSGQNEKYFQKECLFLEWGRLILTLRRPKQHRPQAPDVPDLAQTVKPWSDLFGRLRVKANFFQIF